MLWWIWKHEIFSSINSKIGTSETDSDNLLSIGRATNFIIRFHVLEWIISLQQTKNIQSNHNFIFGNYSFWCKFVLGCNGKLCTSSGKWQCCKVHWSQNFGGSLFFDWYLLPHNNWYFTRRKGGYKFVVFELGKIRLNTVLIYMLYSCCDKIVTYSMIQSIFLN